MTSSISSLHIYIQRLGRWEGCVWHPSHHLYAIYNQNKRFSLPYLWLEKVASSKNIPSSRIQCKNHALFMTKMTKIDNLFLSKTAKKPHPLGPHIPTLPMYIKEYTPPRSHELHTSLDWLFQISNPMYRIFSSASLSTRAQLNSGTLSISAFQLRAFTRRSDLSPYSFCPPQNGSWRRLFSSINTSVKN